MKFHIPFTIAKLDKLKKEPKFFNFLIKYKKNSLLGYYLHNSDTGLSREQYLNICYKSFTIAFIILFLLLSTVLAIIGIDLFFLYAFLLGILFGGFILFSQLIYPKIFVTRKQREVEKNLIPGLQDMLIQLQSGIPLFSILVNISDAKYGQLSIEMKKAVRQISAGLPQVEVLEKLGEDSSSIFFRRTLWQLSNGMKAGSDISIVIENSIKSLNEEQLIQIQTYGNKLNPFIMFYMMVSVILPALAIAFLTIISSLVNLGSSTSYLLYAGLFIFVVLGQIMFLGVIRSSRPSLL